MKPTTLVVDNLDIKCCSYFSPLRPNVRSFTFPNLMERRVVRSNRNISEYASLLREIPPPPPSMIGHMFVEEAFFGGIDAGLMTVTAKTPVPAL